MTIGEAYRMGRKFLRESGCDSPSFDAGCLFQKAFGLDRQQRILDSDREADEKKTAAYLAMARERTGGRPLQYILGEWPFFGLTLAVGEGVLCPREETELLVREAARRLEGNGRPEILDLCSGSGTVALGLASCFPGAHITAAEKYERAFSYLEKNIAKTGLSNVKAVHLDLFDPNAAKSFSGLDAVVCNPPYVRTGEIPGLQREVRREPQEALDGGADGLRFYRALAELWLPELKPGGIAAVEIGEGEAAAVCTLFGTALADLRVLRDFAGYDRVVSGSRKSCFSAGKHL